MLEVPLADVCSGELEVPPAPIVAGGMTSPVGCGRGKKMGGGRVSTVARKLTAAAHLFPLFSRVRHVIPQNATALSGISNDVTPFSNKIIETSLRNFNKIIFPDRNLFVFLRLIIIRQKATVNCKP